MQGDGSHENRGAFVTSVFMEPFFPVQAFPKEATDKRAEYRVVDEYKYDSESESSPQDGGGC